MSKEFSLSVDLSKGSKLSKSINVIALIGIFIAAVIYMFTDKQIISYGVFLFVVLVSYTVDVLRDFDLID